MIQSPPSRSAAVIGGSVSGLMASFVLSKHGFDVVLYEKRQTFNRNIQWGVRQSFIDYLACFDQEMAARFFSMASGIPNGYRFFADPSSFFEHGAYQHHKRSLPREGACSKGDLSGEQTLDHEIVCLVPAKELETFLNSEVKRLKAATVRQEEAPVIQYSKADNSFHFPNESHDLIVVSEGASGKTRQAAGIESIDLSRTIMQVSGEVYIRRHGMIIEYLHAVPQADRHREELLLSLLISTDKNKASWIIGDVSSACLSKLQAGSDDSQGIIENEFRQIAARTMVNAEQNIVEAGYKGAVGQVTLFPLQARISRKAVAGCNLVLAGDAVGVGHWSVGGGVHVAAVCHSRRLEELAGSFSRDMKKRSVALQQYNDGVLKDTIAWISRGIKNYYLSIPGDVLEAVFDELIVEVMQNNAINFPEEFKKRVTAVYFP